MTAMGGARAPEVEAELEGTFSARKQEAWETQTVGRLSPGGAFWGKFWQEKPRAPPLPL